MKIIDALKLNQVKTAVTRTAAVALVAGAALLATPAKANAQVAFGVRVGPVAIYRHGPVYARPYGYYPPAPVYAGPGYGYYGPRAIYAHPYYGHAYYGRRWYR